MKFNHHNSHYSNSRLKPSSAIDISVRNGEKGLGLGLTGATMCGETGNREPKPAGFLCGSIPVTTDECHDVSSVALVSSIHAVKAPRFQMIPTETDLNALPLPSSIPDRVLPIAAAQSRTSNDSQWQDEAITSSVMKNGEALAVSGLVEYGDEIDVIAPTDILKQIFKIPYSKGRVLIAVHRVGQTLILNAGPDAEEGETLIRRHSRQPKCVDQSLFLNFAMHSVEWRLVIVHPVTILRRMKILDNLITLINTCQVMVHFNLWTIWRMDMHP